MIRFLAMLLLIAPASAQVQDRCEAAATEMFVTSMQMALMLKARDATIRGLEARLRFAAKPGRCAGRTVKTEQCKRGRTLNSNCKCGVW
jgi:hypothetical protein